MSRQRTTAGGLAASPPGDHQNRPVPTLPADPILDITDQDTLQACRQFHEQGFLGPFTLCAEAEMRTMRPEITACLASEPTADAAAHTPERRGHNRHLDQPRIHALATHPHLLRRVAPLLGGDVLVWRVHAFDKGPGAGEIPWHQDAHYWPLEPAVVVTAWIACDRTTPENGCLEVVPGSHAFRFPSLVDPAQRAALSITAPDLTGVDLHSALSLPMAPGQCLLFNERLLHRSGPNATAGPRLGLSVRCIPPLTRILQYDGAGHGVVLATGTDRCGFNRHAQPPLPAATQADHGLS